MKNRVIAFALTILIFLSVISVPVCAAGEKPIDLGELKVSFAIEYEDLKNDNIKDRLNFVQTSSFDSEGLNYYYRDSYFFNPSTKYNEHLATLSHIITMVSLSDVSGALYNEAYKNAEKIFLNIGFEEIESNTETDFATTPDTMGVIMAKKTIIDESVPYTLVAIDFRSGGYGSEWANNFTVGTKEECPEGHLGFHNARDRVLDFILDYLDRNVEGNAKIWISGFSRGGALSGLTGAWFNDNRESLADYDITLEKEDIFTYTFEAPASMDAELNAERGYNNIFNIINPNDFIPLLPFEGWGLVRPGIVRYLPDFSHESADELNEILKEFAPRVIYDAHKFTPFATGVGRTQAEFIKKIVDILASRIDRKTYAENLETTLSHMLNNMLNSSEDEVSALFSSFASSLLSDLGISSGTDNILGIVTMFMNLLYGDDNMVDMLCNAMGKNLARYGFIETFDPETQAALFAFIKLVLYKDDGVSLIPYVITMLTNSRTYKTEYGGSIQINSITTAHTPEIVLAALMYEDSYYGSGSANIEWTAGSLAKDDIVTIAVNDGKRTYSVEYPKNTVVTADVCATGCLGFEGWYVDGERITGTSNFTFVADKNMSLRAAAVADHKAMSEWAQDKVAFAFFAGSMSCKCSACGSSFSEIIPAPLGEFKDSAPYVIGGGVAVVALIVSLTVVAKKKRKRKRKLAEAEEKAV